MAVVQAVSCDACHRVEMPVEGGDMPYSWYLITLSQEGNGLLLEDATFCSWDCVGTALKNRGEMGEGKPPRRKRRTRAQIEADEAAAAAASE